MTGIAEMLGEIVRKGWDALPTIRDLLKPLDYPVLPGTVKPTRPSAKGDLKYHSAEELARRLEITTKEFHSQAKKLMKKQFREQLKEIGNPRSPDILLDQRGDIWLRNRNTGRAVYTGQPITTFKK